MCKQAQYTRQGVRDLNHIKGKSVGIKLEMPPIHLICSHPREQVKESVDFGMFIYTCRDCGETWDEFDRQ